VNNDVCPRARPLLDFSLFGELPKSRAMFVFGLCFGLLPVLSIYIEPFLYFFVPGWFIFLISQAFPFLLTPRKETFAFVLGLPFIARRQAALRFFNAMQIRLFLCICTAICVYGATHLNLDARAWAYKVAGFGAALLVPAALLYLAVLGTIVSGIIRPSKKIRGRPVFFTCAAQQSNGLFPVSRCGLPRPSRVFCRDRRRFFSSARYCTCSGMTFTPLSFPGRLLARQRRLLPFLLLTKGRQSSRSLFLPSSASSFF
jgi:hypothetical protein